MVPSNSRVVRVLAGLVAAGLGALAGCASEPDRVELMLRRRPTATVPLPREDPAWKTHYEHQPYVERTDELTVPGELTIERARIIALRGNPDIHAVRARLDQAVARIGEARAAYFPNITLGHNSARTFQTPHSQSGVNIPSFAQTIPNIPTSLQDLDINTLVQLITDPLLQSGSVGGLPGAFTQHSTTLSASWTLFDGFTREATLMAARHARQAARMALSDAQRLLTRAVDTAYYQAQLAKEQLRIAQADVEFSQRQVDVARTRMAAGKATQADVLNFDLRLRAAMADRIAAAGMLQNARTVLAELLGVDDARLPDEVSLSPLEEETEEGLAAPDVDALVAEALAARPDVSQKEYELRVKTEEMRAARGQYGPSILLTGSYGFDKSANMGYSTDDQASAGAIELRWQLFTGGLRTSRVRFRQAERWEIAAELRRLRQQVASEVRQAVTDVVNAQEQVRLQRANLVTAAENRRIVEAEYDAGKASLVRLNEAQRDLIATEARLASARIRLRQARTDLRSAVAASSVAG